MNHNVSAMVSAKFAYIRSIVVGFQIECDCRDPIGSVVGERRLASKKDACRLIATALIVLCSPIEARSIADPTSGISENVSKLI